MKIRITIDVVDPKRALTQDERDDLEFALMAQLEDFDAAFGYVGRNSDIIFKIEEIEER